MYAVRNDTQTGTVNTATDQTLLVTVQTTSSGIPLRVEALLVEIIK